VDDERGGQRGIVRDGKGSTGYHIRDNNALHFKGLTAPGEAWGGGKKRGRERICRTMIKGRMVKMKNIAEENLEYSRNSQDKDGMGEGKKT